MTETTTPAPPRGGRDLKSAAIVGVALLGVALFGILFFDWLLVALLVALLAAGVKEVADAIKGIGVDVPLPPLFVAAAVLPVAAWIGGVDYLFLALLGCLLLLCVWAEATRARPTGQVILAGLFIIMWVPFLLSFGAALLNEQGGNLMLAVLLLMVVANDTFGYIVGYRYGRTPIAPRVSPKKSWEGLLGSAAGTVLVGAILTPVLAGSPWWIGAIMGLFIVAAATSGDFSESMVKRELGIKDMSSLLPGHGGVMDRLDSLVFAAPVAYTFLTLPLG